jgi:flagellar biosynthesis GTPase FlhF
MRTKVFKGDSLPSVIHQVRAEFGDNAVIINTREYGTHQIEVEVGWWVQGESVEQLFYEEEPTLGVLADLVQDEDISGALRAQGVSGELRDFCERHLPKKKADPCDRLSHALSKIFNFNSTTPFDSRCVAILGPSQSGKTTTLIKLAVRLREALGCSVGLVSAQVGSDDHEERLAAYAELLDIPFVIAENRGRAADRIPAAVAQLEQSDLILIDTPGADPRSEKEHLHLGKLLQKCGSMEKLLVVPASLDFVQLRLLLQRFDVYGCSRLVLTKLDQCGRLGGVINAIAESDLPLGFFGCGDRIPQDIEPASARRLASLLLRKMH